MHYFVSDIHLGSDPTRATDDRFVEWLSSIKHTAESLFLNGDIFDFWFEYNRVVPMGFTSVLAKLRELSSSGIRVVMMVGNHDLWVRDYLTRECGVEIYYRPTHFEVAGKRVYLAHGDNLNVRSDFKLKAMNAIFRSETARILFKWLIHPDLTLKFGQWWSNCSRGNHRDDGNVRVDLLLEHAAQRQSQIESDYYIYGHLHKAIEREQEGYRVFFTNDWSGTPHYVAINESGEAELLEVK